MTYPNGRYHAPIFIDPANFAWIPRPDADGVSERFLGDFTEAHTHVSMFAIKAGAAWPIGRGIYFVTSGTGNIGNDGYRAQTVVEVKGEEQAQLSANQDTEILCIRLPDLTTLKTSSRGDGIMAAAE